MQLNLWQKSAIFDKLKGYSQMDIFTLHSLKIACKNVTIITRHKCSEYEKKKIFPKTHRVLITRRTMQTAHRRKMIKSQVERTRKKKSTKIFNRIKGRAKKRRSKRWSATKKCYYNKEQGIKKRGKKNGDTTSRKISWESI